MWVKTTHIIHSSSLLILVNEWGKSDLRPPEGEEQESAQTHRVDAFMNERDGDRQLPLSPHDLSGPLSLNVVAEPHPQQQSSRATFPKGTPPTAL